MDIRKGSRYRTLILTFFVFSFIVTLSYPTGINCRAMVPQKFENIMIDDENNSDVSKARGNELSGEEEAAKLEQWKQKLETDINNYFGQDIYKVGIVYYDIDRDQKLAVNEEKVFIAASTVKVQMNMIAYDWVREGKLSLDEKLIYDKSKHWEAGTGKLQSQDKSKPLPVQQLLDYSIIYSDNIATRMIMERLGSNRNVRAIANRIAGTNNDTVKNVITAEEEFRLLKILYENRNDPHYAHLIETMKKTQFNDRLSKYLPKEIVAHKTGDYAAYVHDVGIIFTEKPYILVVYTNDLPGLAESKPHEKIAGLSKLIYDAHINK
ncbi:serine hydrolase [Clostridium thermarum]|uniref:serine hydrolase n=1 Tax=Clostridium thermarum TaxID=1716543 RepID=UPI0013D480D8|nr:serine hydrolase [Clostridium thermarum]